MRTVPLPSGFFGGCTGDDKADERYERNARKAATAGLEPCETCGRGVADGKGFAVVVTDGGASILHPEDDTEDAWNDSGYMGGYVVGSTCAKQIPAEFRITWRAS
jgi:hypothetical protein